MRPLLLSNQLRYFGSAYEQEPTNAGIRRRLRARTSDNKISYRKLMNVHSGAYVARRRAIVGLSQRDLARSVGVTQPLIAAIETGAKPPSQALRAALEHALAVRPSAALDARRSEVRAIFARAGLPEPRVFGSVARGSDDIDSDLDVVVEFTDQHD